MPEEEKILGIDQDILIKFLELIRDKYPLADKANYFLETELGESGINIATTNQRDVLSHLVTLVKGNFDRQKQIEQLSNAEEHFRRAIFEPYEEAINLKIKDLLKQIEVYKEAALPLIGKVNGFNNCPDNVQINARIRGIQENRARSREAKSENLWNEKWEEGVKLAISTFREVRSMEEDIENCILKAHALLKEQEEKEERKHSIWESRYFGIGGIILGILGIIVGIALALF